MTRKEILNDLGAFQKMDKVFTVMYNILDDEYYFVTPETNIKITLNKYYVSILNDSFCTIFLAYEDIDEFLIDRYYDEESDMERLHITFNRSNSFTSIVLF